MVVDLTAFAVSFDHIYYMNTFPVSFSNQEALISNKADAGFEATTAVLRRSKTFLAE